VRLGTASAGSPATAGNRHRDARGCRPSPHLVRRDPPRPVRHGRGSSRTYGTQTPDVSSMDRAEGLAAPRAGPVVRASLSPGEAGALVGSGVGGLPGVLEVVSPVATTHGTNVRLYHLVMQPYPPLKHRQFGPNATLAIAELPSAPRDQPGEAELDHHDDRRRRGQRRHVPWRPGADGDRSPAARAVAEAFGTVNLSVVLHQRGRGQVTEPPA